MSNRYFNRKGRPIEVLEWAKLHNQFDYVSIAKTHANGLYVSTVWLGIDHRFGEGAPLIFETMVFPGERHVERYVTEEEAKAGHETIVARAMAGDFGTSPHGVEAKP